MATKVVFADAVALKRSATPPMEKIFAMNDSDDIVKEFLVESYENLDRLDRDLITLEKNPDDRAILAGIFRTIHTIKGTSGFLAFDKLGAVAHIGESLLGRLRDGQLALDREITNALLAMVDAVRQMLASIEATGNEGERDDEGLISNLTRLQELSEKRAPVEGAPSGIDAGESQAEAEKVGTSRIEESKIDESKIEKSKVGEAKIENRNAAEPVPLRDAPMAAPVAEGGR
ncbi:MAG: Hpt domain-containing protein, partial [Terriglobales bacterium]